MRESSSEIGTVNRAVSGGLGRIKIFAPAAVKLDRLLIRYICQPNGQERLRLTVDAGAAAELPTLVLFELGFK